MIVRPSMLLAAAIATTKHSIPTRAFSPWPNPSTIILNMSSSSSTADSSHTQLTQAKHLISKAISIGAPAYNAGNIAECARVYQETAKEIAPLVPSTLQSKLLREVEDGDIHNNPDAKAWALRRVFDSIIEYQPPLVPQATADTNTSYEPFSKTQLPEQPLGVMDNVMGGYPLEAGSHNQTPSLGKRHSPTMEGLHRCDGDFRSCKTGPMPREYTSKDYVIRTHQSTLSVSF
eukprot:g14647.t1 g14647   contig90:85521-86216(-)